MSAFTKSELSLTTGLISCHEGGQGRPLLYLHSAGGLRLSPALEQLAESYRLYLPVMPGFDDTAKSEKLKSMIDLADMVAEVIDSKIKGPCDVLGYSFGGWIAAWLAVRHPDKVQQLVLAAPAGFRTESAGTTAGESEYSRQMMFAHPENLPATQTSPEIVAQNRAMAQYYRGGMTGDRDLITRLQDIEALTLIISGSKDGIIPVENVRLLKERIRHSSLIYVYDAAHALDVDQPDRFARLVKEFLTRGEAFIVNQSGSEAA